MRAKPAAVLLVLLSVIPLSVWADTVFDSFGPGDAVSGWGCRIQGSDYLGGLVAIAASFTPTSDYWFSTAVFPFSSDVAPRVDTFDVCLMSDSGGLPGTIIESFLVVVQSPQNPSTHTITSLSNPLLGGGTTYWFAVSPHYDYSHGGWNKNTLGFAGYAYLFTGRSWGLDPESTPAFRVEGTRLSDPIPEPSTMLLLALGLIGLTRQIRGDTALPGFGVRERSAAFEARRRGRRR